jgi:hypothetical protein
MLSCKRFQLLRWRYSPVFIARWIEISTRNLTPWCPKSSRTTNRRRIALITDLFKVHYIIGRSVLQGLLSDVKARYLREQAAKWVYVALTYVLKGCIINFNFRNIEIVLDRAQEWELKNSEENILTWERWSNKRTKNTQWQFHNL